MLRMKKFRNVPDLPRADDVGDRDLVQRLSDPVPHVRGAYRFTK